MQKNKDKPNDSSVDALDKLLDKDNDDNVILYNEKDEAVEFEQVALIVYKKKAYAILHPVEGEKHGIDDDEALVFEIQKDRDGDSRFVLVEDEAIIDAVFKRYDKMYDEENGD